MNKLTKLLFSIISSVAVATSAFAGDFSVTGGVKATYTVLGNSSTSGTHGIGKGLGISNEFSLSASGELDNGMTWSYAQDIDGATVQDDANIAFGTDYGTIKLCVSECGLSTKYAFDNSAYGVGSDNGYGGGAGTTAAPAMSYGSNISSYNNIQYHAPADLLPFGMTFKAGTTPGGAGGSANASSHSVGSVNGSVSGSMDQYAVTVAPIDGLKVSGSYYRFGDMGNRDDRYDAEGGSLAANYSIGQLSVGYGETRHVPAQRMNTASATARTTSYMNDAYSIGFAVNDNLSVSFTEENSEERNVAKSVAAVTTRTDVEMKIQTFDVSYTMGGATLSLSRSETENESYNKGDEVNETIAAISLAF